MKILIEFDARRSIKVRNKKIYYSTIKFSTKLFSNTNNLTFLRLYYILGNVEILYILQIKINGELLTSRLDAMEEIGEVQINLLNDQFLTVNETVYFSY